jgi:hypothetical protein
MGIASCASRRLWKWATGVQLDVTFSEGSGQCYDFFCSYFGHTGIDTVREIEVDRDAT